MIRRRYIDPGGYISRRQFRIAVDKSRTGPKLESLVLGLVRLENRARLFNGSLVGFTIEHFNGSDMSVAQKITTHARLQFHLKRQRVRFRKTATVEAG